MNKKQMRRTVRGCLLDMSSDVRRRKSQQACQRLIATSLFQDASTIMMYLSLYYEVDTTEAILHAWQCGKTIAVPRIFWKDRTMVPVQIDRLDGENALGVSGLRNPRSGPQVVLSQIDLIVVPGLAFDLQGNRLGHGGGYYDRFLADTSLQARRCGFAFSEQIVDRIPVTETDQGVDCFVTDAQLRYVSSPIQKE